MERVGVRGIEAEKRSMTLRKKGKGKEEGRGRERDQKKGVV